MSSLLVLLLSTHTIEGGKRGLAVEMVCDSLLFSLSTHASRFLTGGAATQLRRFRYDKHISTCHDRAKVGADCLTCCAFCSRLPRTRSLRTRDGWRSTLAFVLLPLPTFQSAHKIINLIFVPALMKTNHASCQQKLHQKGTKQKSTIIMLFKGAVLVMFSFSFHGPTGVEGHGHLVVSFVF